MLVEYFILREMQKRKEGFQSDESSGKNGLSGGYLFFWICSLIMGMVGAYLSWSSNTVIGWGTGSKAFFAFFAFLSGCGYVGNHVIHKLDMLKFIKDGCTLPPGTAERFMNYMASPVY